MTSSFNTWLQVNRTALDKAVPGDYVWEEVSRVLNRWPEADGLERRLMLDRLLMDTAIPDDALWTKIALVLDEKPGLESYIQQNREAFDQAIPGDQLWERITAEWNRPATIKVHFHWQRNLVRVAAAVAFLLTGISAGIMYERSGNRQGMQMADVSQEYAELEQFYQRNIYTKQTKLSGFTANQSEEVNQDLKLLDDAMAQLRQELARVPSGNREQVVRAMIENYKAKAAILQRVLERLESNAKGDNNGKLSNEIKSI